MICVYPADCTDFSTNGNGTIEPTSALVTEAKEDTDGDDAKTKAECYLLSRSSVIAAALLISLWRCSKSWI